MIFGGKTGAHPARKIRLQAPSMTSVRAMFFDVFGTLVDWRTRGRPRGRTGPAALGYNLDWTAFADAWRAEYQPGMEEVRSGRIPFSKLDVLHRRNLERFMPRFGMRDLPDEVLHELTLAWHRLDAWPDVPAALKRLRKKFLLAPVSNGNISLMVDLARRNDFPWDAILGAEVAGDYKPKPRVYLAACEALDLAPAAMHDGRGAQQRSCCRRRRAVCAPVTSRGPMSMAPALAKPGRLCRWMRQICDLRNKFERSGRIRCAARSNSCPHTPARAVQRNSPGCDTRPCSFSAGSLRARCRASP